MKTLTSYSCGCKIIENGNITVLKYCSVHEAAEDMYDALKLAQTEINAGYRLHGIYTSNPLEEIEKALTKAEGK